MKRLACIAALLCAACVAVPLTGRKQLILLPQGNMLSMSYQEYDAFLKKNPPSSDKAAAQKVAKVGASIQRAVEQFFAARGMTHRLSGYRWEFHLVDNKEANAWCMPGGKVVVYSGILPLTKNETGLAVVMGHEIAHAVADHGNERMSQSMLAQMGGVALGTALKEKPEETRELWMTAFGVGAQYGVLLPYSRVQESEADRLGLIFMAMAGYDPHEATAFWTRMSQKGGQKPPEIMSTHPSDETRVRKINEDMAEAMMYYKP